MEMENCRNIVDYLFQMLHDKASNLSVLTNDLVEKNKFGLILCFLQAGYCRNIDMKSLLHASCRHKHFTLAQWILENVEHKELDIKSSFLEENFLSY